MSGKGFKGGGGVCFGFAMDYKICKQGNPNIPPDVKIPHTGDVSNE